MPLLCSSCKKNESLMVCDVNIGKLEYENISIMGATYDFYDEGYAFLNEILHENVQITDIVTYNNKDYTVIGIGGFDKYGRDEGKSIFGHWAAPNKSPNNLVLPDTALIITSNALAYSSAESIILPSNVKRIGGGAFIGCFNITNIEFPGSLEFISGYQLFFGCTSLEYVEFPDDCEIKLLGRCFENCTSLKYVAIPDNIIYLQANEFPEVFCNCDSLESVTLPRDIVIIQQQAFRSCPSLTKLVIPESVTLIQDQAFVDCPNLVDITLPDGLTDVSSLLFANIYMKPEYNPNLTIRVKSDMVDYVQSIYPEAKVIAK